ncbi:hypothetical protein ACFX12_017008 [Malus domestica]
MARKMVRIAGLEVLHDTISSSFLRACPSRSLSCSLFSCDDSRRKMDGRDLPTNGVAVACLSTSGSKKLDPLF